MNKNKPIIPEGDCILKHYAGSIAYGTNLPNSDIDFRGLFKADDIYLTPLMSYMEYTDPSEEDTKYFELSRFFELAATKNNPNMLESLWVEESDIVYKNEVYDYLRAIREDFLSKKVAITSAHYALNSLKRSENKNKWINKPQPKEVPVQCDFISLIQNFSEDKVLKLNLRDYKEDWRLVPYGKNIFGIIEAKGYSTFDDYGKLNVVYKNVNDNREFPKFIIQFNKDKYDKAKEDHKGYWDWKNNRNEKRRELEEENGYDTKDAMHLVRLMRVAKEILLEEVFYVKRKDFKELLDIRNGKYSYKEIMDIGNDLKQEVLEAAKISKLKEEPDFKSLSKHLVKANYLANELKNKIENTNRKKNRLR